MSRRKEPAISADILDRLPDGGDAASALRQGGLLDSLKTALADSGKIGTDVPRERQGRPG
jgi:hypothetical protein